MEDMVRVLALAFESDDPIEEYVFPDLAVRRKRAPGMIRVLIKHRYLPAEGATVALIDGKVVGALLWIPGGYRSPRWREAISGPQLLWAMGAGATVRGIEADAAIAGSAPAEPHDYMVYLGADPQVQGAGVGRALTNRLIADADAHGRAVCGICKDDNVRYYQPFGLQPVDRTRIGSKGPELNFMLRPAARVGAS
ncbi:GNAT family N-acetyltransferase [Nocardia seriolae]|nr:GNAT family N-acetyltransferase [Nocardia seriolae]MTJ74780.1 GNAT family N-acetyltransferase [Nocardia seriolae]MTJ86467.1 GNAT family N-acetyltransferase [Nocardia seriolae]MTK30462.1 GNAT family N-acetyltransferase [Nocardia seriolae]MTK39406.1 GNAT family N-acetyltransferase [Nocardia seriolae]